MRQKLLRSLLVTLILGLTLAAAGQSLDARTPADLSSRNRGAIEVSRDKILADRKGQLAAAMKFTDDEARAFWPVYDEYARELTSISDSGVDLLTRFGDRYKDLSDTQAAQMASESLVIDQKRLAVRQKYEQRFLEILPGKKVARFIQVERRLDAVVVLNLAQAILLVE